MPLPDETTQIKTDQALIQLHLSLVETALRSKNVAYLSTDQKKKRNEGLDILHAYWQTGIFPVNLYHSERTPYFIDHLGTACAVGHILIETGYCDFAKQIHTENNYGYIFDLEKQYPFLKEWAFIHGFAMDELAWIQPSYCTGNNPTCYGFSDGSVNLQMPVDGTPPFSVSGPPCAMLGAGTYEYTITDANGYVYIHTYTLVDPAPIEVTAHWISDATSLSSCDGSATVSNTGGVGTLTYYWVPCSGTGPGVNAQTVSTLCAGEYKVVISDSNGCSGTSECITIGNLASVNEQSTNFIYTIFPNPSDGILNITLTQTIGNSSIELTDISGRIILRMGAEENNQINLSELGLESGCYFVKIENNNSSAVEKVVFVK